MEKNNKKENIEDATKYGEFICSEFGWSSLKKQKERAEELENNTKRKKK